MNDIVADMTKAEFREMIESGIQRNDRIGCGRGS